MKRAAWTLAALLLLGCQQSEAPGAAGAAAPPTPRATVSIEPPRLRLGDVAVVEVMVVTPPGHRVHPVAPPERVAGLWLLDAETLPVERDGARWTERTRIRVRAREIGATEWPAMRIDVEGPEGERSALETEARPLEVVAVSSEFPDQVAPFPYRMPAPAPARAPALAAAAAGALAALAGVAALSLVRRARRRRAAAASAALAPAAAPWADALAGLEAAAAAIDTDWRGSADEAGQALRRYVTRRFALPLAFRTTEEAAALSPPFALATRWADVLAVLRALDSVRFQRAEPGEAAARVRDAIEKARRWVAGSIPPESAR
ncbi:MAG TPA: hypothetical protein VMH82_05075 [Myxococcota bacterium]|nr:hypothetical protein [Myxococcota bacterium]